MQHIKCDICETDITYWKDGDICHNIHFDIIRANKTYDIINMKIEEDDVNIKMKMSVCKDCFDKILNESNTLGSLFYDKERNKFIY